MRYTKPHRALFNPLHPPGTIENNLPPDCFKGYVDPAVTAKANAARDAERERIERARGALPPVESILGLDEFQVCTSPYSSAIESWPGRDQLRDAEGEVSGRSKWA
jgi:hypothetical protein